MGRAAREALLLVLVAAVAVLFAGLAASSGAEGDCSTPPVGSSVELLYRLEAGRKQVTPATRERAVRIVCERLLALAGEGQVSTVGSRRIRVLVPDPGAAGSQRAIEQIGAVGQVYFYDWEANLIGPERTVGAHPGREPPAPALHRLERAWRAAGRDVRDLGSRQLILAGALPTQRAAIRLASRQGREPTTIVSELPLDRDGGVDESARPGWFALRDRPALSGADIVDPRQETGELGEPNVTFGFTRQGRIAFRRVTRAIARRGSASALGPVTADQAAALSGHFAIVFEGEVKTRPIINFTENPQGIDGRAGAQIAGGFDSVSEARDLATILRIGALPISLALVRKQGR